MWFTRVRSSAADLDCEAGHLFVIVERGSVAMLLADAPTPLKLEPSMNAVSGGWRGIMVGGCGVWGKVVTFWYPSR